MIFILLKHKLKLSTEKKILIKNIYGINKIDVKKGKKDVWNKNYR